MAESNQSSPVPSVRIRNVVRRLLGWFRVCARDLPWRRTTDPYAIWVSEIMLQQTQVATVLPYYNRWMRQLPSIDALASAPEERLLKLWEGLGYYSRVRNLKRAALEIVATRGGVFPRTFEQVLDLPGIGPYTAGAICSIAFNQPVPAVDGNVARVLSRIFMVRGSPKDRDTSRKLLAHAGDLANCAARLKPGVTQADRPCGKVTEALMELGALVCTPAKPNCPACPVASVCLARQHNVVRRFPAKQLRAASTRRSLAVFLVTDGKAVLLRQRVAKPNAGFWELPCVDTINGHSAGELVEIAVPGIAVPRVSALGTGSHTIMNQRISFEAYRVAIRRVLPIGEYSRYTRESLEKLPLSTITRKVLALRPAGLD